MAIALLSRRASRASVAAAAPGLAIACALAAVAVFAGTCVPLIGAPVFGVVLGAGASVVVRRHVRLRPGVAVAASRVLPIAVVLLGAQLSLRQVADVGVASLPVMLCTLTVCLLLAWLVGRRLGIGRDLRTLIGVGTAVCGASAIAAVTPTIRAKHPDVAYAITTIFVFNIAAVLAFPPLGHALGLGQHAFGLFAGTAVNDTSSVVAAASTYGVAASHYAIVVKLTRTLMIVPICLVLGVTRRAGTRIVGLVPPFLIGFLVLAAANSAGLIPTAAHSSIQQAAAAITTLALTGIGLSTDVAALRRSGARPLVLGFVLWLAVTLTSLAVQTV